jgi:hypothetical protein
LKKVSFAVMTENGDPVKVVPVSKKLTLRGKLTTIEEVPDIYEDSRSSLIEPKI